jgi:hypothetical protein
MNLEYQYQRFEETNQKDGSGRFERCQTDLRKLRFKDTF